MVAQAKQLCLLNHRPYGSATISLSPPFQESGSRPNISKRVDNQRITQNAPRIASFRAKKNKFVARPFTMLKNNVPPPHSSPRKTQKHGFGTRFAALRFPYVPPICNNQFRPIRPRASPFNRQPPFPSKKTSIRVSFDFQRLSTPVENIFQIFIQKRLAVKEKACTFALAIQPRGTPSNIRNTASGARVVLKIRLQRSLKTLHKTTL